MNISVDKWLLEAKNSENAGKVGMWLAHNGVVRSTAKADVRGEKCAEKGIIPDETVKGMTFSYDRERLDLVLSEGKRLDGVYYLRAELAEGELKQGDDIMYVLIGADTRDHAVNALDLIVGRIKNECVKEEEILK